MKNEKGYITGFLDYGERNSKTSQELQKLTGLSSSQLRRVINAERKNGCYIMAGNHGYYLAETASDIMKFCVSMRHRATEIESVANAMEEHYLSEEGRITQ